MKDATQIGMTRLNAFGINLRLVTADDLPMLSRWRNDANVRPYMDDGRVVTPEVMLVWLNRTIANNSTYPFIASIKGTDFGYLELKKIDRQTHGCESGMFLFGDQYIGTGLGVYLALCREILMEKLQLHTLVSKIRKSNHRSLSGANNFDLVFSHEEGDFLVFVTGKEKRQGRLWEIATKLHLHEEFGTLLTEAQNCEQPAC